MKEMIKFFNDQKEKMEKELEATRNVAYQAQQEAKAVQEQAQAAVAAAADSNSMMIGAPRIIQIQTSYESLIDNGDSVTPSKRLRTTNLDHAADGSSAAAISSESVSTASASLSGVNGENESDEIDATAIVTANA